MKKLKLDEKAFDCLAGIERETLRIDKTGRISQKKHPFSEKEFDRDFCEAQTEIITPPVAGIKNLYKKLEELDSLASDELDKKYGEKFLIYSNPPYIESDNEIEAAQFSGEKYAKTIYRDYLAKKYGKKLMLFCGIHFNYSFSDEYVSSLQSDRSSLSFKEFKNKFYFKLMKYVCLYSRIPLILTASSPVYDLSFDKYGEKGLALSKYASIRSGEKGYWNDFCPILNYNSINGYIESIKKYIDEGKLYSESELYLPVRLKSKGNGGVFELENSGADHIEMRMFDVNPLEKLGIAYNDMEFASLFLIWLSTLPDFEYTPNMQIDSIENHKKAALYNIDNIYIGSKKIAESTKDILNEMYDFYKEYPDALKILDYELNKLNGRRPCEETAAFFGFDTPKNKNLRNHVRRCR